MDSMIFMVRNSGLTAPRARISKRGVCILRSCYQLQRYSQPMAPRAHFGMEVASYTLQRLPMRRLT